MTGMPLPDIDPPAPRVVLPPWAVVSGKRHAHIDRVTAELWPGTPVIPTMGTGATDGSRLRNAGIPTFGVAGQFYGDSNAHGMNERIPEQGFYESLEFMYRLVAGLSRKVVP